MAKPKKRKSLLQSQREKLARQRAARRAAQRANRQISESNRRSLPSKGRTTATSPRARVQRGLTRDRLAKQQLQNFGRALQRSLKQRQAQNKLDKAAKGTKGGQTRTAGGAGQLARRRGGSSSPTSQRIQPVRVRVEGQKQLPAGKSPAGQLPAKTTQKTQPVGKPSARRAEAAAKQARQAQGSKGPNRVGQPKGAANRFYGATRVNQAVSRAQRSSMLGKAKGRGGLLGTALMAAGGAAAQSGLLGKKVQDSFNEFNSRADKVLEPGFFNNAAGGGKKPEKKTTGRGKPIRNRRGRIVGYEPARRGMSNIPQGEGTGKGSPNDKKTTKPASASTGGTNKTKPQVKSGGGSSGGGAKDVPSNSKKNPYRMPQGSERKDRMSKVVRELQEMRRRSKKRQGKKMSKAVSKGYPGNRNY